MNFEFLEIKFSLQIRQSAAKYDFIQFNATCFQSSVSLKFNYNTQLRSPDLPCVLEPDVEARQSFVLHGTCKIFPFSGK